MPPDPNDGCDENLDKLASTSRAAVENMPHVSRVGIIERCRAPSAALEQLAGEFARLNEDLPLVPDPDRSEVPSQAPSRNGDADVAFQASVVAALSARLAPEVSEGTTPPEELPLRTFHSVAEAGETMLEYDEWLAKAFTKTGLTRCTEFAWVRACERGVSPDCRHDRDYAFYRLYRFLDPALSTCDKRPDWIDAVVIAWREFDDLLLASNTEIATRPLRKWLQSHLNTVAAGDTIRAAIAAANELDLEQLDGDSAHEHLRAIVAKVIETLKGRPGDTPLAMIKELETALLAPTELERVLTTLRKRGDQCRDRYGAIGSLFGFLRGWALWRLPKPAISLTGDALDAMKDEGVPAEVTVLLEPLIMETWSTKEQCLRAIEERIGGTLQTYKKEIAGNLERTSRPPLPDVPEQPANSADPSRIRLTRAILENQIPDGGDLVSVIGKEAANEIITKGHWGGCQHVARWSKRRPLTDTELVRLDEYCIGGKTESQIAAAQNVTRPAMSLGLFNAMRKIRCCLATKLGDEFFANARVLLKAYLAETQKWQDDPDAYRQRMEVNGKKAFPLPGSGLLATVFPPDQAQGLCKLVDDAEAKLAVGYHCDALVVGELAPMSKDLERFREIPQGVRRTDLVSAFLEEHWLAILPAVENALIQREGEG